MITTAKHYAEYRWGAVEKKNVYSKFPLFSGILESKLNNKSSYIQHVHLFTNLQFSNEFMLGDK